VSEPERDVAVADLTLEPGDVSEYELASVASATLVGDRGSIRVECRYEALPRQNDTVDRGAVDTDDELLGDAASVHVHTKFWAVADDGPHDEASDGPGGSPRGQFLRDAHTRWEPTDPSVLTDGTAFEAACRAHFEETLGATYERGAAALGAD